MYSLFIGQILSTNFARWNIIGVAMSYYTSDKCSFQGFSWTHHDMHFDTLVGSIFITAQPHHIH